MMLVIVKKLRLIVVYVLLVGAPVLILMAVLRTGARLAAPAALHDTANALSSPKPAAAPDLFVLVAQIAVIILASRAVGFLFQKLSHPQVIGEMLAGIMLGPSLLGWLAPGVSAALFPATSLGTLNAISQLALVTCMFLARFALNAPYLPLTRNAPIILTHVT